ncbi:MAG: hypothetical protein GY749_43090 [Desulfobacteraceae bacterium]|nr:hypothetical protein [Desulfobacteraceae bacterium]
MSDKDKIWLSVKVGRERELLRFRIHWAERVYTVEKVALLFPMSTFNALLLSYGNPGLRYYPEGEGRITRRFKKLLLFGLDKQTDKLAECLSGRLKGDNIISFTPPFPAQNRIKACADQFHIRAELGDQPILPEHPYIRVNEALEGYQLGYDNDGNIITPVDALSPDYREISSIAGKGLARIDMIEAGNGFRYIVVYVKERNALFDTIEELKNITVADNGVERNALDIHEFSHDAVTRFGFISDIVNIVEKGFLPVFFLFLFFMLFVQIGVVLNHRSYNFGVLLAKGFCTGHIYLIIFLQIFFCFIVGYGLGGLVVFYIGVPALSFQFKKLIAFKNYGEYIDIGDVELLMLSTQDYCHTLLIMLSIILLVTYFQLRVVMKLKNSSEPSQLLHD